MSNLVTEILELYPQEPTKVFKPNKNTQPANNCEWYTDHTSYETVHFWSGDALAYDSKYEGEWRFRKCLICGIPDIDDLNRQYKDKIRE